MTEYRFINNRHVYIIKEDLPAVERLFEEAGWIANVTATYPKLYLLSPRTADYMHATDYEVLKAFAQFAAVPGSHIILERMEREPFKKDWLHIVYSGNGKYWEEITAQGQWDCNEIGGAL